MIIATFFDQSVFSKLLILHNNWVISRVFNILPEIPRYLFGYLRVAHERLAGMSCNWEEGVHLSDALPQGQCPIARTLGNGKLG
jgi:hypothetical protein